jgi:hypothetical protein
MIRALWGPGWTRLALNVTKYCHNGGMAFAHHPALACQGVQDGDALWGPGWARVPAWVFVTRKLKLVAGGVAAVGLILVIAAVAALVVVFDQLA